MIEIKKQKITLALLLLFVTGIFITVLYAFVLIIPTLAENAFGKPDSKLERSRLIILSIRLIKDKDSLTKASYLEEGPHSFAVDEGQSAGIVAGNLELLGFIPDAESVVNYWAYKGYDRLIQSGVFLIQPNSTPLEIADKLANELSDQIEFAFPPGWRKEEIDYLLHSAKIISSSEQLAELEPLVINECFPETLKDLVSIEGFLFPSEYGIWRDSLGGDIYCMFVEKFFNALPLNYSEQVAKNGLSFYDAVILASIIQKEAVIEAEAPVIAGVFINRLNAGMPLQSDPTVQYAIADAGDSVSWWKNPLESTDLEIDSLYNTYLHNGLPPTPICNPDLNSLMALANPEASKFYYFRSACDQSGRHIFSETYQQHLDAACE